MNILQILPQLETGGVETGTVDLCRELLKRGHGAVVISSGGVLVKELEVLGARHYRLDVHKKSVFTALRLVPEVTRIIRRERIEIVHARSRVPAWIGFFAARLAKVPFITTCHGYYRRHLFSRVMGWGKYVIVISNRVGRHMIDDFGVAREKIRLIYRGVDLERFPYRGFYAVEGEVRRRTIGIVGRITPLKGHQELLKAMPGILTRVPEARLVIVGEAAADKQAYLEELKQTVRSLNLEKKVEFCGRRGDVAAVLARLDVLVLATTTPEGFGRVIIEAAAVGVPVVATRVGGVTEIISHEQEGLLAEPGNPYELTQAVVRLLRDTVLAKQLAARLRTKVMERFSLASFAEKTIGVYEEAHYRRRILIIKLSALGDVILAVPALRALRRRFPEACLEVLVKKEFKDILQLCPYIDNLIIMKRGTVLETARKIREIRRKEFDFSIDFQNSRTSHLLSFCAAIPQRFGYRRKLGRLLNRGLEDTDKEVDPLEHQFRILKQFGIELTERNLELWVGAADEEYAADFLREHWVNERQMLIGINPAASRRWQSKAWPYDRYARLADRVSQTLRARVIFTGVPDARETVEQIIGLTHCKPINAAGRTTVMQLAALLKHCAVFVTVDSAPMHMAAALDVPFVALFGPTHPRRHVPPARESAVIYKDVPCAPCYRARCYRKICLREISVEEVEQAVIKSAGGKNRSKAHEYTAVNHTS